MYRKILKFHIALKRGKEINRNMSKRLALASIVVIFVIAVGYSIWAYVNYLDFLGKTVHETERWAVIEDSKGDIIAVETTDNQVWNELRNLRENQTAMWIGGIVEKYNNEWGFHFKPETIIVAEITIEGAQSNIQGISEDLNYWISVWAKETYVLARVTEIHE